MFFNASNVLFSFVVHIKIKPKLFVLNVAHSYFLLSNVLFFLLNQDVNISVIMSTLLRRQRGTFCTYSQLL